MSNSAPAPPSRVHTRDAERVDGEEEGLVRQENKERVPVPMPVQQSDYAQCRAPLGQIPLDKDALRWYYAECMPFLELCDRLCRTQRVSKLWPGQQMGRSSTDETVLPHREFSITGCGGIYRRYLSYDTPDAFRAHLLSLIDAISPMEGCDRVPAKIDIGACYPMYQSPHLIGDGKGISGMINKGAGYPNPCYKEVVFDFDLDAYNDVRLCDCPKTGGCCDDCWYLAVIALRMASDFLRYDVGLDKEIITNVFSGRKGVHVIAWHGQFAVHQRQLARKFFVDYFAANANGGCSRFHSMAIHFVNNGIGSIVQRLTLRYIGMYVEFSLVKRQLLKPGTLYRQALDDFVRYLGYNARNSTIDGARALVVAVGKLADDMALRDRGMVWYRTAWLRFNETVSRVVPLLSRDRRALAAQLPNVMVAVAIHPRPDVAVTADMSHLLKAPFSPHPKNGLIAVPLAIDPHQIDPNRMPVVPSVRELYASPDRAKARDEFRLRHLPGLVNARVASVGDTSNPRVW